MKSALKKKWVEALRSGDYQQGRLYLRRGNSMMPDRLCCLGVLCNVAAPDKWIETGATTPFGHDRNGQFSLGIEFLAHVDLSDVAQDKLTQMNDAQRRGFGAIANWIEKNL